MKRDRFARKINDVRFLNQGGEFFFAAARFNCGAAWQRGLDRKKSAAKKKRQRRQTERARPDGALHVPRCGCGTRFFPDKLDAGDSLVKRRRARQPAARMRQPMRKVRRQVSPDTLCSP